ncbi:hypothetical protein HYV83_04380 [Candidatus Woesearchaeota archaeon]|nr:hypothetical protein [Candidatus Woesearchaeota archaeon]
MNFQDVFIVGATGRVGRKLIEQLIQNCDTDPGKHTHPTRIVGLASSKHYLFNSEGLSSEQVRQFSSKKGAGNEYNSLDELINVSYERNVLHPFVFIDVTAVQDIAGFHLKLVEQTPHKVVTANKNPLALSDYGVFRRLTKSPLKYDYRCSVMAGAEAVVFLRDLRDVNDRPQLIQGCLSGTLGYICSQLEDRPFSEILAEAHQKGYTEPHPRDDLNGLDVARKLLILARTAGYNVSLSDVKVKPFIPEEFLGEDDVAAFLNSARQLDEHFANLTTAAAKSGNVLRYVAKMDAREGVLTVSLQEVSRNSQLGTLQGTLNKLMVVSRTYPMSAPYSIEAPGAGLEVTAQNIRRGLLALLPERQFKE